MDFEYIYNQYFNDVYLYIRRLSNNEHIAEEITSECFYKAMQSIDRFRNECDIRVWLCQIAKNCYFTYQKKVSKISSLDELEISDIADTSDTIEEHLSRQDEAMQIRGLLHTIPDPYKEVFMWRAFGELNFNQIGQIFGKTDNWACVTYHRARIMIKKRLEDNNYEK